MTFPERYYRPLVATLREVNCPAPSVAWSDLATVSGYVERARAYASPQNPMVVCIYSEGKLVHGQLVPERVQNNRVGQRKPRVPLPPGRLVK